MSLATAPGRRKAPAEANRRQPGPSASRTVVPVAPGRGDETAYVVSTGFTMLAIVCLWMLAQLLFLGGVSQDRSQELLYREFRSQLASGTAPVGPVAPVGAPVALLSIPEIGLQEIVVEGTASGDMLEGPGHRRDTALPGQAGISVIYGRATTYGGPFGDLAELQRGDTITTVVGQGRQVFTVIGIRREGDPLLAAPAADKARLTLVTGEGKGRLGGLTASSAVYVDAEAEKAFPAPAGRPRAIPDSEKAMASDQGALPLFALCLAALVVLTLAVIAARQRWSAALVWVVAAPVAVALSWASTDVVMRLLPNLI